MKLNPRQKKFVAYYVIEPNATQAALKAGYSEKTAKEMGYENLTKPHVAQAVELALKKQMARLDMTADDVVREYMKIARAKPQDYFEWGPDGVTVRDCADLTPDQCAAVQEVSQTVTDAGGTIRVKLYSRQAALDSLSRHFGLFKDKLDVNLQVDISGHVTLDTAFNAIGNLTGRTGPQLLPAPVEAPKKVANG